MVETIIEGIPASPGIVIGQVYKHEPPDLTIPKRVSEDPSREWEFFEEAVKSARLELEDVRASVLDLTGEESEAAIFDAHMLMLDDPMLSEAVRTRIDAGMIVEEALVEAIDQISNMLAAMDDEYFAARAADVRDIGHRVLRILLGIPDSSMANLNKPSIVVAQDLTPSDTAKLNPRYAIGFCTAAGGMTSHTAILARTLGIPAVVGLGEDLSLKTENGTEMVLDGIRGLVVLKPVEQTCRNYRKEIQRRQEWLVTVGESAKEDTYTADGRRIEVGANIGDIETAKRAVAAGAEGVGLLRTEFLYLEHTRAPEEVAQVQAYQQIFEALSPRGVIVRTLDIGGDKPPTYMEFPEELNPFLGWRAIRIGLENENLLKTQLRAILRAAEGHNVLIMYPMISSVEELEQANRLLSQVRNELSEAKIAYASDVPVGIMVETPAAAMIADLLAEHCDFLSIGTNDLTQYTLAVDRTNERVAHLYQPLHPAVLRLINHTIEAGHKAGIWVGMCGELAGMLPAIPILVGFGLDEFSMAPSTIPEAKWLIRKLTGENATKIAQTALSMKTAAEVEDYMREFLKTEFNL